MDLEHALSLQLLVALLLVTGAVGIAVRWIKIPYAIALVIAGLVIGIFHLLPTVVITPELILFVFLPVLLFEASWNIDLKGLKESFIPVAGLATLGVIMSAFATSVVFNGAGLGFAIALLFGTMVAATDPISVLSLFKKTGAPKRLTTIIEGESLLNDGTAVVLFNLVLAATIAGTDLSWGRMLLDFLVVTTGGTIIGGSLGYVAARVTRLFEDHLLETTLTVLLAYGSYLIADNLHVSPIITVLVAGIVMGNYGSRSGMGPATRLAVNAFWEYAAFLAESMVFLLIGMQIDLYKIQAYLPYIGTALLAMLFGRIVTVYALVPFLSTRAKPIPMNWRHILFWGGLRGSLCMAMALSLPVYFPYRELLIVCTFGVVFFSLLVQGLTTEPLVRLLNLIPSDSSESRYLALKKEQLRLKAQIEKLKIAVQDMKILRKDYNKQREELQAKIDTIETSIKLVREKNPRIGAVEKLETEKALLNAQKDCLNSLKREGTMDESILDEYLQGVNSGLNNLPRVEDVISAQEKQLLASDEPGDKNEA